MEDMFEDNPLFAGVVERFKEHALEEGIRQGLEQGIQQGIQQEKQQALNSLREMVISLV
jgi:flagellar biosynthesis/type III secretory pathway protein FliH